MKITVNNSRIVRCLVAVPLLAAVLSVTSCTQDELVVNTNTETGEEAMINLSWSVAGMNAGDALTTEAMSTVSTTAGTRLVPDDLKENGAHDDINPVVHNMWIIQFDGNTPSSKMMGVPRFLDSDELTTPGYASIYLIQKSTPCYTLFVANIREGALYKWNLVKEAPFSDVITRVKTIKNDDTGCYEDFTNWNTLLMSAVTNSTIVSGTALVPKFTRNVAKVTLNLKLSKQDMEIVSVRLRNVSNRIVYADAALSLNGVLPTTVYPLDVALTDYPAITKTSATGTLPTYSQTESYSWYIPRNQQDIVSKSTNATTKTYYAPVNATYFEIVAIRKDGTNISATSIFRVYPGADMISDFNLTSNSHYTVGLDVVDIGNDSDSRVEKIENIDYAGNNTHGASSNSFILNPAPKTSGMTRKYTIPISQVNRFWGGTTAGYGNKTDNVIKSSDKWKVELIWSDLAGLFGSSGITLGDNGLGVGVGLGADNVGGQVSYFTLNVPAGLAAGNFVLGIKKVDDYGNNKDNLWSWHFWVTDYNPNSFDLSKISAGTYTYPVSGGQVERYAPLTAGAVTDVWTGTGVYANRVMMDRNLGAVETFFSEAPARNKRGTLHYQFGRKDPFSTVYATGSFNQTAGPTTIATTVLNPDRFYTSDNNWCNEANVNTPTNYLWNDPIAAVNTYSSSKSIYDPCPPGWMVPVNNTWVDFGRTPTNTMNDTYFINVQNFKRDLGWSYGRGIGSENNPIGGLRYWPGSSATAPVAGKIWYPATGDRDNENGNPYNLSENGYYWSATTVQGGTDSRSLNFYSGTIYTGSPSERALGFAVRCVAE